MSYRLNKIYLFVAVLLSILCVTCFFQFLTPKFFLTENYGIIRNADDYQLVEFSINTPTYNFYYNDGFNTTIYQYELNRKNLFQWEISQNAKSFEDIAASVPFDIDETKNQFGDKKITDVREIAKEESQKNDFFLQPEEKRYYELIEDVRKNDDNIELFRELKVGMSWEEVVDLVGESDRGYGSGGVTNTNGEINYFINKDGIAFIALGWDKYPQLFEDATLINAIIVKDDRSIENIDIN